MIYGAADGTGTAKYADQAINRAISEALERWAFYSTVLGPECSSFGFDVDSTSSGMAAFPAIFGHSARRVALQEAVERWALIGFWEERLAVSEAMYESGSEISIHEVDVSSYFRSKVVIVHQRSPRFGVSAYGFAAGDSLMNAISKAKVELFRNVRALEKFFLTAEGGQAAAHSGMMVGMDCLERRLVYFSTELGYGVFLKKLKTHTPIASRVVPKKLVDCEIVGPWSKYARVWRVLFEPLGSQHASDRDDVFFF